MKIRRLVATVAVGAAAAVAATACLHTSAAPTVNTRPASTAGVPIQVYRTGSTPGGTGVWMHTQADPNSPRVILVPEAGTVLATCFVQGPAILGNPVWEFASYNGRSGYLTDYYLNIHWNTTQDLINQGLHVCGTQPVPPQADVAVAHPDATPSSIAGVTLGTPENGRHQWAPSNCLVQDFKHSSAGWVIVSYSSGTHVMRNGMLWGVFDQGGLARLGCPVDDEYPFAGGHRQDFQHGSLFWEPGWDHAKPLPQGPGNFSNGAIADYLLARINHNLGTVHGECRQAVDDAVAAASGMNLGVAPGTDEANHYQAAFRRLGAVQVDPGEAVKGDIVQVSDDPNSSKLHTYVIVQNLGGGNFLVVDSNHNYDHTVREYQRAFNYAGDAALSIIWRLGKV